jgi:hypothetical protein
MTAAETIARQLSLIEFGMFAQIRVPEWLQRQQPGDSGALNNPKASNLHKMLKWRYASSDL